MRAEGLHRRPDSHLAQRALAPPDRLAPCFGPRRGLFRRIGRRLPLLAIWAFINLAAPTAFAAPPRGDAAVLNRLIGNAAIASNVTVLRTQAAALSVSDRYDWLKAQVLPADAPIRCAAEFTSTCPVPRGGPLEAIDLNRLQQARKAGSSRIATGGLLVSPVFDLIEAARDLNRLAELDQEVFRRRCDSEIDERARLALLTLIAVERHDIPTAATCIDQLDQRLAVQTFPELDRRWPETLVAWKVWDVPELREPAALLIRRLLENQVRLGANAGPEPWDRLITALWGRLQATDWELASPTGGETSQWSFVTAAAASSRGQGCIPSEWRTRDGVLRNVASHADNYLFFRSPLLDNFVLECDMGAFDYHDTFPVVVGRSYALKFSRDALDVHTFRGFERTLTLAPVLNAMGDWRRTRVAVQDVELAIAINGREVVREPAETQSFPWLGIKTPFYSWGQVRNVRLSGDPVIPDRIPLVLDARLAGWTPYMRDHMGPGVNDWRFDPDLGASGGLVGRHKTEIAGMMQESLLRYMRPMLEDGEISYEFFYEPGRIQVHPALDRLAFLLRPDGVQIHGVTNDYWDRTGLDPLNQHPPDESLVREDRLPLVHGWNRMEVRLRGDEITLTLNETPICRQRLDPANDRTFGLFHYADQTEVRVRDVMWRGDWPRTLPPPDQQTYRNTRLAGLDASIPDADSFEFDFRGDMNWADRFQLGCSVEGGAVDQSADGLQMSHPGSRGFQHLWLRPLLAIEGDFDVVAEFRGFDWRGSANSGGGMYLTGIFDDDLTPHCSAYWGVLRRPDEPIQHNANAEISLFTPQGVNMRWEGQVPQEATAGKLRLARRGRTVSVLFADAGSQAYHLVHEVDLSDRPLRTHGVRFGIGLYSNIDELGSMDVTWTRVELHADRIVPHFSRWEELRHATEVFRSDVLAGRSLEEFLSGLAVQPLAMEHEFSRGAPAERFAVLGDAGGTAITTTGSGACVARSGRQGDRVCTLVPQLELSGDFDVVASFDGLQADPITGGGEGISLAIGMDDAPWSEYLLRWAPAESPEGAATVQGIVRQLVDGQMQEAVVTTAPAPSASGRLRVLRQGDWLLCLFAAGSEEAATWRLAMAQDVGAGPTRANGLRLGLERRSAGAASVVWKRLSVRAAEARGPALIENWSVAQLDAQQANFTVHEVIDFATTDIASDRFKPWPGGRARLARSPGGLLVEAPGAPNWTAGGFTIYDRLYGDFDVTLDLSDLAIDTPDGGNSTVGLSVLFSEQRHQAVQVQVYKLPNDETGARVVTATGLPDGSIRHEELQAVLAEHVGILRIARRGEMAYLLFQAPGEPMRLVQRLRLLDNPRAAVGVRVLVHAGSSDSTTRATLRRLTLHAERIEKQP